MKVNGKVIFPGVIVGTAKLIENATDHDNNLILVLENLLPNLVLSALDLEPKGVVARSGGLTAHGAALLREAQIPALTQVVFPDDWLGQQVRVNAITGFIEVLENA